MSYEAGAAIGVPIVQDRLGFRISAWRRHDSGWIDKTDYAGNVLDRNSNSNSVTVHRAVVAGRGARRPEERDHAAMGAAWDATVGTA